MKLQQALDNGLLYKIFSDPKVLILLAFGFGCLLVNAWYSWFFGVRKNRS